MALTELQKPTKTVLYGTSQSKANKLNNLINDVADFAEFISFMDASDLSDIPAEVQSDLMDFRTSLNEFIAFVTGGAITRTVTLSEIIDKIRSI